MGLQGGGSYMIKGRKEVYIRVQNGLSHIHVLVRVVFSPFMMKLNSIENCSCSHIYL